MEACTKFCASLRDIKGENDALPSHDDLMARLQLNEPSRQHGRHLGRWKEVQSRDTCPFCQLVVAAITNSKAPGDGEIDPDQPIDVLLFPGENSFRLSYPSRMGTRISFVADLEAQVNSPENVRIIDGTEIHPSRILGWLKTCDTDHGDCYIHSQINNDDNKSRTINFREDATSNFRVIDLEEGCLKRVALGVRYVALSYVWGHLPMFRLRKDNWERLSTPGYLESSVRPNLPRTINDTIDLVKALDEKYLWIDALCLVQDDESDMSLGIELMNSIYQGSYFTIVAASGVDAHAGLAGLRSTSNLRSQSQIIRELGPRIKMAVHHSIDCHLGRATYNTRAWTLQELVLSRRAIIFVNNQVYFRCQQANWSEETWADRWTHWLDPDDSNISRIPAVEEGRLSSLWGYQKLCEDYSGRKLRKDGDALCAIAGICRPLFACMETVGVEGLPGYYLDMFVLFISSNADLRRRTEFASFSFAGWEGKIMWPRENYIRYANGSQTRDTANILKWFKHQRIVDWQALEPSTTCIRLSSTPIKTSCLEKFLEEFPDIFPEAGVKADQNPYLYSHECFSLYSSIFESGGHLPHWDVIPTESDDKQEENGHVPRRPMFKFPRPSFELVNSQAEFDRLIRSIQVPFNLLLMVQNWRASRTMRMVRRPPANAWGPRSIARGRDLEHYRFREPRDRTPAVEDDRQLNDPRARFGTRSAARWVSNSSKTNARPPEVPKFPPYTVLQFQTVAIHLLLGDIPTGHAQSTLDTSATPFNRIPGVPLLSAAGNKVGSLHPDNIDLLGDPGSKIECLIVARSQTPTVGSAISVPRTHGAEATSPQDLLWILHVVWRDGIAERRGVGQVLTLAVRESVEPCPQVKMVFLG